MDDILEQESFYIDKNGNSHTIYPMLLKDYQKVNRLFQKINREFLFLNLPTPKTNRKGNIVIDKTTKEPIMDNTSYNAMMDLFELALHEPKEEIEQWVDLKNGVQILDEYSQVSGLKERVKKNLMETMEKQMTSLISSQA